MAKNKAVDSPAGKVFVLLMAKSFKSRPPVPYTVEIEGKKKPLPRAIK